MRINRAITIANVGPQPTRITNNFSITVNGLVISGRPRFAEWEHVGELLRVAERACPFAIGEFVLKGEEALGDRIWQIVDYASGGWSEETIRNYRWLAEKVPATVRRMDRLSVRHHQAVAALPVERQRHWLDLAAEGSEGDAWTVARMLSEIAGTTDAPTEQYWVVVSAATQSDQLSLVARMVAEGRSAKATTSRRRRRAKSDDEEAA